MTTVLTVCFVGLGLASALSLVRLVRPGGSLADRIVALDTLLVVSISGMAVWGLVIESEAFSLVLLVTSLLAFLGTVTAAKFVERRGG
jgi:multicomponent Na+:H+ antiporter subunit F